MRVEGDIVIERPQEEVFDFVADECNEPQYNPRMTRAEKISSGPIAVGTQFRSVMTGMGGGVEMTIEFIEYDRPRRITEKVQLSTMDINGALFFEPVPEGTRMKWIWDLEPHGFYKLMGPLIRRIGERQERTIWTSLKHLLEAQTRPSLQVAISAADRGSTNEASTRPEVLR
jgi:carbon monoxide dehydrogenase subunit G